jgi:hypothetical protein
VFQVAERVAIDRRENGYLKVVTHPFAQARLRGRIELPPPGSEESERLHWACGQSQAER